MYLLEENLLHAISKWCSDIHAANEEKKPCIKWLYLRSTKQWKSKPSARGGRAKIGLFYRKKTCCVT